MQPANFGAPSYQRTTRTVTVPVGSAEANIGVPIYFHSGELAGHTLRLELVEVQKADRGRRYAVKDRRPLDPPPVVRMRMYEVCDPDTPRQSEREIHDLQDIRNCGFICHVDLFPVPDDAERPVMHEEPDGNEDDDEEMFSVPSTGHPPDGGMSLRPMHGHPPPPQFALNPMLPPPGHGFVPATWPPLHPAEARQPEPLSPVPHGFFSDHALGGMPAVYAPRAIDGGWQDSTERVPPPLPDVVGLYGDWAITSRSICTTLLVGERFVEAASVPWEGKRAGMFIFGDLAVRSEGTFVLRYRLFNVFSRAYMEEHSCVVAECFGGPFRVYSTKAFPGLSASTDLTKYLSFAGARANMREKERKGRKRDEDAAGPSTAPAEPQPDGLPQKGNNDAAKAKKSRGNLRAGSTSTDGSHGGNRKGGGGGKGKARER